MRSFNKIFVIALPRCATVSVSEALGILGIRTAHLGRIYGEQTGEHNDPVRLARMLEQLQQGDYQLDLLNECDGLADYPACCRDVIEGLDREYSDSLFINVRRDGDLQRWLQSVERQFVGLRMVKAAVQASVEEKQFMQVMLRFREMTFGQAEFDAEFYLRAYHDYQAHIDDYFRGRSDDLLTIEDISQLEVEGFQQVCRFLDCAVPDESFPRSNQHSEKPYNAFMRALEEGTIVSQTGIRPVGC